MIALISAFSFSDSQLKVIEEVYVKGRQFDLGLTMAAIVIKESAAGKYRITINRNSVDCGIYMFNSKTLSNNHWSQSRICERLIKDDDFSFSIALKRFKYFYNYYRSKKFSKGLAWKRAIMSYHSGWNYKAGKQYYKDIVKNIKFVNKLIKGD